MDLTPRIESLQNRREAVKAAIHEEQSHPYHDERKIHLLKLENLHLKEEMYRLETAANTNTRAVPLH